MTDLFVVRRPFRNYGKVLEPGTIVTPEDIKRFKTRLNDRIIVEVTDSTLDRWDNYFVGKFGVSIKPKKPVAKPTVKVK